MNLSFIFCCCWKFRSLKQTDWEQFLLNIIAHNLVVQMRLLKKAKEKRNQSKTTKNSKNDEKPLLIPAAQNETNLIELFFDLEAEIEKGVCRDQISYDSIDKEHGIIILILIFFVSNLKFSSFFYIYKNFCKNYVKSYATLFCLLNHSIASR